MKKTKKFFGIIMAAMMTATVFLGSFSAGAAGPAQSTGTEDNPAQAKIVKTLKYADGITEPDDQFNFTFTKVSVDDVTTPDALAVMPELSASVAFNDDTGKYNDQTTEGLNVVSKQSANIFDGKTFPHAGVYVYTVVEEGTDAVGYGMDYSEAVYTMRVYVKNGVNGTYVASVTAEKTTDDDGTTIEDGEKVDPTPDDDTGDGISNEFAFVNVFTKKGGFNGGDNTEIPEPTPDPGDKEYPEYLEKIAALVIDKTVAGEYGDKTMDFSFSLTLTKAPTAEDETYTATIYTRGNGTAVDTKTVTPGTPCTFTLKDNQMLIFEDLPAGTTYDVSETAVAKYTTTTELIANGVTTSGNAVIDNALVGEEDNYARYTNTFDDSSVTPTGIIINNLPFILMIVLAGAGIVLFVITRRRKYSR